jgi:GTP-binding protein HflX
MSSFTDKPKQHVELPDLKLFKTALLIASYPSGKDVSVCEDYLNELERLCETFGLEPVGKIPCAIKKIESSTFLGKGKLDELVNTASELKADIILFDDEITPHQQRNLEKIFQRPVLDRTELIIEVFAQRAQTREARLQVELAKIRYQIPRLKRLWTHLERQVSGGGGFLKGAGEKQIELDRRMLKKRIDRLQEEIKEVAAKREVQRSARLRSGIPTFAIIGYTNAGKSTLLKALTQAEVLVEDKLFATLDTTTRKFILPNRQEILLVDTVGFIRKIPHTLVAAFKSTLEEAIHTDILLHLVDVSNPSALEQAEATYHVLKEMKALDHPIITVMNKVDACASPVLLHKLRIKYPKTVQISALHQTGFTELMELMMKEVSSLRKQVKLRIPQSNYALVSELLREGRVIHSEYEDNDILLDIEIPSQLEYKVKPFLV